MARTPSKEAHEKVLNAALELIAERGVEGASMDAIAAASGVSKATVYKHWANKEALLIDVLQREGGELPEFDSGDPRADLLQLIRFIAEFRKSRELGRIWPRIIAHAIGNPEFGQSLREHSSGPRRKQIARLLSRAAALGQLRQGIDVDLATDLLIGPVMHRRFNFQTETPADLPEIVVDSFWHWGQPHQKPARKGR